MHEPKKQYSFVALFIATLFSFAILYNISLQGLESLSSARIAVFSALIATFFHSTSTIKLTKSDLTLLLIFVVAPYGLAQLLFTGDFGQTSRFLHLFLYSFVGSFLVARLSDNYRNWFLAILFATAAQGVILFYSFVSLDYRAWASNTLATAGNFGVDYIYRAPGLSSDAGSSLSVTQSLGVLSGALYLSILNTKKEHDRLSPIVFFLMIVNTLSCIVVGRTGLMLSIFFICFFTIRQVIPIKYIAAFLLSVIAVGSSVIEAAKEALPSNFSFDFFQTWALGFFSGEDNTARELTSMPIPPLGLESFFGYGLVSIVDGANPSGHDSGFIQTYFSLGLAGSAIFFGTYLLTLTKLLGWLPKITGIPIAFLIFFLEIKEPFVFKYSIMFFLVGTYFAVRTLHLNTKTPTA